MNAMEYMLIPLAAFLASLLTFFSGFGLGTILLPIFAIWFTVDIAIALTAVVHLLNNIFKTLLVGKHVNTAILLRFGTPAILSAFAGAALLAWVTEFAPLMEYGLLGKTFFVTPIKLLIATLMIFFVLFEIISSLKNLRVDPKYLPLGGVLSGFFGGLSGHQGALRSAFLIRTGLSKESFVATGTVIACLIDFSRLSLYTKHFVHNGFSNSFELTVLATLAAFAGALLGSKLLAKVTLDAVQNIVSCGLFLLAIALGLGFI